MQRVLVTGASGFIGQYLLKALSTAPYNSVYEVIALAAKPIAGYTTVLHKNYHVAKEDFHSSGIHQIDIVIHAGAYTPKDRAGMNDMLNNTNIYNTEKLLHALPGKLQKFIYLSTLDVYANTSNTITEDSEVSPGSLYAWSKLYCEKMIDYWCKQQQIIYQVLRIGHIYGAGEEKYNKLIPATIRKILHKERPEIINDGIEKRSFLHIADCVQAILAAIELKQGENVINIVSGKWHTVKEIVQIIIELSGSAVTPVFKNVQAEPRHLLFDSTRMEAILHKERIDLRYGLEEEIKGFRV